MWLFVWSREHVIYSSYFKVSPFVAWPIWNLEKEHFQRCRWLRAAWLQSGLIHPSHSQATLTIHYSAQPPHCPAAVVLCFLLVEVGSLARTFSWKNSHQRSLCAVGSGQHRKLLGRRRNQLQRRLGSWLKSLGYLLSRRLWHHAVACLSVASHIVRIKPVFDPLQTPHVPTVRWLLFNVH